MTGFQQAVKEGRFFFTEVDVFGYEPVDLREHGIISGEGNLNFEIMGRDMDFRTFMA
jgi:hypothetical protein